MGKERPELRGELYNNLDTFISHINKNITEFNYDAVIAAIPTRTFVFEVKPESELRRAGDHLESTLLNGKCHLQGPAEYYNATLLDSDKVCGEDDLGYALEKLEENGGVSAHDAYMPDVDAGYSAASSGGGAATGGGGGDGALKPCKPCAGTGKSKVFRFVLCFVLIFLLF